MSASPKWFMVLVLALVLFALASSQPALARLSPDTTASTTATDGLTKPPPLDHFWCYQLNTNTPVNEEVGLKDQFDAVPVSVTVGSAIRLCNPVKKNHNGVITKITHPNDHLVVYDIGVPNKPPKINVEVSNQFGTAKLEVFLPAQGLAVPSKKNAGLKPEATDHFKCYRVRGDSLSNLYVGLKDQFQRDPEVKVLKPYWLCNPTVKNHKDQITDIRHRKFHLVCYTVKRNPFVTTAVIDNQFGPRDLITTQSDLLCVPSKKKIII